MDLRCMRCNAELHTENYAEVTAFAYAHAGECPQTVDSEKVE